MNKIEIYVKKVFDFTCDGSVTWGVMKDVNRLFDKIQELPEFVEVTVSRGSVFRESQIKIDDEVKANFIDIFGKELYERAHGYSGYSKSSFIKKFYELFLIHSKFAARDAEIASAAKRKESFWMSKMPIANKTKKEVVL